MANAPKEFDANNPPIGLSHEQVAVLQAEQKRLAASTPLPVKRDQQIAALQATQAAATSKASAASRTARSASTMFSGKGTDAVLSGDVYDIKESTTLNSVFESAKGGAKDAVDYLKSNKSDARGILNSALELKAGNITKMDALSRLGIGMNSATFLKIKSGAGGILDKVTTGLGISPDITDQIKIGVDGAFSYITNNDITRPQSSFDLMKSLLNEPELLQFFDIESETTLLTGMFTDAVDFGMMDVVEFTKKSGRYDQRSFEYAVMSVSTTAVYTGDLDVIEELLKHISVEQFLGQNPDAVNSILTSYKFNPLDTPNLYPAKLARLVALLVRLDPNWYKTKLNGEYVNNYGVINGISGDAIILFKTDDILRELVLVAPFYPSNTAINLGSTMYPGSAVGSVS
jgi:hypothetical protein